MRVHQLPDNIKSKLSRFGKLYHTQRRVKLLPIEKFTGFHSNYWDSGSRRFWSVYRNGWVDIPTAHPFYEKEIAESNDKFKVLDTDLIISQVYFGTSKWFEVYTQEKGE